jgi:hypothetical protein
VLARLKEWTAGYALCGALQTALRGSVVQQEQQEQQVQVMMA